MHKTAKPEETDGYLIAEWSKRYGREISLAEVQEINANLSAFVDVMERMDRYLRQKHRQKKPSEK